MNTAARLEKLIWDNLADLPRTRMLEQIVQASARVGAQTLHAYQVYTQQPRNEGGKTEAELQAAGLMPGRVQKPFYVDGRLAGFTYELKPLISDVHEEPMIKPCTRVWGQGSPKTLNVSSIPPSPHAFGWYPAYLDPTPPAPKAKLGDKRPALRCKKCSNIGRIVVAHVDASEVRLMCKLCGKEEVEK